jgi:hypothetical protein
MTPERKQRILAIADELEAQGLPATNSSVYSRVLGHRGHVVAVMRDRRQQAAQAGGVTVMDIPDEDEEGEEREPSAAVLQEDLDQLVHSYDAWHLALERLWEIEQDGPLSEANFSRKQWLEYQMVQNLQTQERLRPQLDQALIREAVYAAQEQHDTRLDEARAKAEAFLQAVATVAHLGEDLADEFTAMVDAFFPFRDRRGHQAFDVRSGPEYASELFQAFFANDYRAKDAFELLMGTPLTIGRLRAALDGSPRLKPFSATAMAQYLAQQGEGTPHGTTS